MVEPLRMSPATRRALQVVAVILLLAGVVLFGLTFVNMGGGPTPGDSNFGPDSQDVFGGLVVTGFGGVFLMGIGGLLAAFAFRKPMSELAATDTEVAVEHSSAALGRGLKRGLGEGGLSRGRAIVKIKCRACGFLESEDARFCSSCSKAM